MDTSAETAVVDHGAEAEIDEGLYSRQLYVLGHEAMRKMNASNVLISGVKGLGIEIGLWQFFCEFGRFPVARLPYSFSSTAKNVILGGVKSLTIHDPESVQLQDLGSQVGCIDSHSMYCSLLDARAMQFFLRTEDIGQNRADVTINRLAELNTYVPCSVFHGKFTQEELIKYQVCWFREILLHAFELKLRWSSSPTPLTKSNLKSATFVTLQASSSSLRKRADYLGLLDMSRRDDISHDFFSKIFCDFGDDFVVTDENGENPLSVIIASVSKDAHGVVTCLDETRHGFEDGDHVVFSVCK